MGYMFLSRYLVKNKLSFDKLYQKIKNKEITHNKVCDVILRAQDMKHYSSTKRLLDKYCK